MRNRLKLQKFVDNFATTGEDSETQIRAALKERRVCYFSVTTNFSPRDGTRGRDRGFQRLLDSRRGDCP